MVKALRDAVAASGEATDPASPGAGGLGGGSGEVLGGVDKALDTALITAPEARDARLLAKLDAVAGRVLNS